MPQASAIKPLAGKSGLAGRSSAWFRRNLTLNMIISMTAAMAILVANSAAGYYALSIVYNNKLVDTWAIMFLELEREGNQLGDKLRQVVQAPGGIGQRAPDAVVQVAGNGRLKVLQGGFPTDLKAKDFGLDDEHLSQLTRDFPRYSVLEYAGERFLSRFDAEASILSLWSVPKDLFLNTLARRSTSDGSVYILTRQGRLLAANRDQIKTGNVVSRPLVQRFIAAPVRQGQNEYVDDKGQPTYGFFYEVPETNVVLFSEVEKSKALQALTSIVGKALSALAAILLISILLLQYPLTQITAPLREMVRLTQRIGRGDFAVEVKAHGFGELRVLTTAFDNMSRDLRARDDAIKLLLEEQTQKVRLEAELAIASTIQSNLLPDKPLPEACGAEIATAYLPAGQCAGDWYGYFHNQTLGETVVAIADVSGHGTGSSMFTAMIACLFDQYQGAGDKPFAAADFARAVDKAISGLGKLSWHATMLILRYVHAEDAIEVLFAGHTPPYLNYQADAGLESRSVHQPSPPCGIGYDAFKPGFERVPFPKGSSILIYTDGLTEACNHQQRMFGNRRARKVFLSSDKRTAAQSVKRMLDEWQGHRGEVAANDDTCVIVLRAV